MSNEFDSIISEVGPKLASIQTEHITTLSRTTLRHSDNNSYILSTCNSTVWESTDSPKIVKKDMQYQICLSKRKSGKHYKSKQVFNSCYNTKLEAEEAILKFRISHESKVCKENIMAILNKTIVTETIPSEVITREPNTETTISSLSSNNSSPQPTDAKLTSQMKAIKKPSKQLLIPIMADQIRNVK